MRAIVVLLAVVLAAAGGLGVGLGVAAECPAGPVPGLTRAVVGLLIGGVAIVLMLLGIVLATVRRSLRQAWVPVALAAALAGGFVARLIIGSPNCPTDPNVAVDGTGSVTLDAPYGTTHQGSIACHIDRATGRTVDVTGGTNRSEPPEWQTAGRSVNFTLTTERTAPRRSASFELVLGEESREWGYRSDTAQQLAVDSSGRQGTLTFTAVPLIEDPQFSDTAPSMTVSGELSWRCDAP